MVGTARPGRRRGLRGRHGARRGVAARGDRRAGHAARCVALACDRHRARGVQGRSRDRGADGDPAGAGTGPEWPRGGGVAAVARDSEAGAAVSAVERTEAAQIEENSMALNRSFLFAPGSVARRVEKALTLEADAVIVDLEDSVAASDKAATRKAVAGALSGPRRGRGYVRVNAASTPYCYGDLVETIHKGVDGVVLPKVESAGELHAIDWLLANLERERGLAEGSIDLMPQIETAAGVQRIERIVQAKNLRAYQGPWRGKPVAVRSRRHRHHVEGLPRAGEPAPAHPRPPPAMI